MRNFSHPNCWNICLNNGSQSDCCHPRKSLEFQLVAFSNHLCKLLGKYRTRCCCRAETIPNIGTDWRIKRHTKLPFEYCRHKHQNTHTHTHFVPLMCALVYFINLWLWNKMKMNKKNCRFNCIQAAVQIAHNLSYFIIFMCIVQPTYLCIIFNCSCSFLCIIK